MESDFLETFFWARVFFCQKPKIMYIKEVTVD